MVYSLNFSCGVNFCPGGFKMTNGKNRGTFCLLFTRRNAKIAALLVLQNELRRRALNLGPMRKRLCLFLLSHQLRLIVVRNRGRNSSH